MNGPITGPQRNFIDLLRERNRIKPETLDQLCEKRYGAPVASLSMLDASSLIDVLRNPVDIKRDLLVLSGQQELFPM